MIKKKSKKEYKPEVDIDDPTLARGEQLRILIGYQCDELDIYDKFPDIDEATLENILLTIVIMSAIESKPNDELAKTALKIQDILFGPEEDAPIRIVHQEKIVLNSPGSKVVN